LGMKLRRPRAERLILLGVRGKQRRDLRRHLIAGRGHNRRRRRRGRRVGRLDRRSDPGQIPRRGSKASGAALTNDIYRSQPPVGQRDLRGNLRSVGALHTLVGPGYHFNLRNLDGYWRTVHDDGLARKGARSPGAFAPRRLKAAYSASSAAWTRRCAPWIPSRCLSAALPPRKPLDQPCQLLMRSASDSSSVAMVASSSLPVVVGVVTPNLEPHRVRVPHFTGKRR
jgi:hypothetical protein